MNKKKMLLFLVLALSITAIFASAAYAANGNEQVGMLRTLLKSFGGEDLGRLYKDYSAFIDMIVYLILFIGIAEWTLGKRMNFGKSGKMVTAGIGIILAVGLALYEQQAGFNLMSFGPIAMAIIVAVMGFAFYEGLQEFGVSKTKAACFAYIAAYAGLSATGVISKLMSFGGERGTTLSLAAAIAMLGFWACLIILAISAFISAGGWFGSSGVGSGHLPPGPSDQPSASPDAPPATDNEKKKAKKDLAREEKFEAQEIAEIKQIGNMLKQAALIMADKNKPLNARGQAASSVMKELRKRHLPRLNRFNKRAEKVAARLLRDLKSAGSNLAAEDEAAINDFEKMRKDILEMEALFSDNWLVGNLRKNPSDEHIQMAYDKFDKAYKDLNEMMNLAAKVYAIDKKLEKQIEGK